MNAAVPFTHAEIRQAALVATALERMREARQVPPPYLVAVAQANQAAFEQLPQHMKDVVTNHFYSVKQAIVNEVAQEQEQAESDAFFNQADQMMKDFTRDMAGRPNGLTMEQAGALQAGARPVLRINKMPRGKQADEIVRQGTAHLTADGRGLTEKQFESRLLHLAELGVHHPRYEATAREYFGDMPLRELDKLVVSAVNDSVGVELRRRAEKSKPDTVTMPKLSSESRRRLDVISAISEVESNDPRSMFHEDRNAGIRTIAREEASSVRGAVAQAVLEAGGLDAIDYGRPDYEDTAEVVDFDESEMETDNA
jgi:hypothetical protein